MLEPGQANFITRDALLQILREYGEVALRVAQQLSQNYYSAYEEIRTLGLTTSPAEKLAKLLLSWQSGKQPANGTYQIKLTLTHEEIAENDRHDTRDREPVVLRLQEEAVAAGEGLDFSYSQQASPGEIGSRLSCAVTSA